MQFFQPFKASRALVDYKRFLSAWSPSLARGNRHWTATLSADDWLRARRIDITAVSAWLGLWISAMITLINEMMYVFAARPNRGPVITIRRPVCLFKCCPDHHCHANARCWLGHDLHSHVCSSHAGANFVLADCDDAIHQVSQPEARSVSKPCAMVTVAVPLPTNKPASVERCATLASGGHGDACTHATAADRKNYATRSHYSFSCHTNGRQHRTHWATGQLGTIGHRRLGKPDKPGKLVSSEVCVKRETTRRESRDDKEINCQMRQFFLDLLKFLANCGVRHNYFITQFQCSWPWKLPDNKKHLFMVILKTTMLMLMFWPRRIQHKGCLINCFETSASTHFRFFRHLRVGDISGGLASPITLCGA